MSSKSTVNCTLGNSLDKASFHHEYPESSVSPSQWAHCQSLEVAHGLSIAFVFVSSENWDLPTQKDHFDASLWVKNGNGGVATRSKCLLLALLSALCDHMSFFLIGHNHIRHFQEA